MHDARLKIVPAFTSRTIPNGMMDRTVRSEFAALSDANLGFYREATAPIGFQLAVRREIRTGRPGACSIRNCRVHGTRIGARFERIR
jgi:hypothetical protein